MPIGSFSAVRFWNVSRSSMRATVMREASRRTSSKRIASNHSEFRWTSARCMSITLPTCATYVARLASTSARVSCGRSLLRPDGSPTIAVESPTISTIVWPARWSARSLNSWTQWPRCRSGELGSMPNLTRSGRGPLKRRARSSRSIKSTAPRAKLSRDVGFMPPWARAPSRSVTVRTILGQIQLPGRTPPLARTLGALACALVEPLPPAPRVGAEPVLAREPAQGDDDLLELARRQLERRRRQEIERASALLERDAHGALEEARRGDLLLAHVARELRRIDGIRREEARQAHGLGVRRRDVRRPP